MNPARKVPTWQVDARSRGNARRLRRDLTDAERAIWHGLRAHRLGGFGFKRQVPIGPYVADFVCHTARLVVEIDGGQHFQKAGLAHDKRRDSYLEERGFTVLRFDNIQALTNRNAVLEAILAVLAATPSQPSPAGGGGLSTGGLSS